jgi:undecaprenyl-diphosphatase
MTLLDSLLLGVVQGLTEFLPVSSSGHLQLGHDIFDAAEESLFFDVLLHVGTLIAVFWVYRNDLLTIIRETFAGLMQLPKGVAQAFAASRGLRTTLLVILATIPTGVIGLLGKDLIEGPWVNTTFVSALLLVNGTNLFLSRFIREKEPAADGTWSVDGIGPREALLIGIAQGIAVLPGISRSGTTIMVALFLGARRERAAQFSFLLAIPAILGAAVLAWDTEEIMASSGQTGVMLAGAAIACLVGVVALKLLLQLLRKAQFHVFAWYCWAVGIAGLVWSLLLK